MNCILSTWTLLGINLLFFISKIGMWMNLFICCLGTFSISFLFYIRAQVEAISIWRLPTLGNLAPLCRISLNPYQGLLLCYKVCTFSFSWLLSFIWQAPKHNNRKKLQEKIIKEKVKLPPFLTSEAHSLLNGVSRQQLLVFILFVSLQSPILL